MAILANVETNTGEVKSLYLRVNNIEVSNHGVKASALIRGFISKEAFNSGKHFAHEEQIEFDANVSLPIWEQVYVVLKGKYLDSEDC